MLRISNRIWFPNVPFISHGSIAYNQLKEIGENFEIGKRKISMIWFENYGKKFSIVDISIGKHITHSISYLICDQMD